MRATLRHDFEGAAANSPRPRLHRGFGKRFTSRGLLRQVPNSDPVHPARTSVQAFCAPSSGNSLRVSERMAPANEDVLRCITILMKRAGGSPLFESSQAAIPKAARSSRREIGFVKQWSSSDVPATAPIKETIHLPVPCGEGSKPPNAPRREPPPIRARPSRHPSSVRELVARV